MADTVTPQERAELRAGHWIGQAYGATHICGGCAGDWPCEAIRLLDALDEADRLNAALTARLHEFAAKLGRRLD